MGGGFFGKRKGVVFPTIKNRGLGLAPCFGPLYWGNRRRNLGKTDVVKKKQGFRKGERDVGRGQLCKRAKDVVGRFPPVMN